MGSAAMGLHGKVNAKGVEAKGVIFNGATGVFAHHPVFCGGSASRETACFEYAEALSSLKDKLSK